MQTGKTILTSYFEWKGHDITVQISMLSGKEWVYVDGELVSQKSNWYFKSSHMIEIEGEKLEVQICLNGKWMITVFLKKGYRSIDEYEFGLTHVQILKGIGVAFACGLLVGFVTIAVFFGGKG